MANPTIGGNPWSSYMVDIYRSRQAPQPLGTVIFEEIEAKAKEKLKDCGGASSSLQLHFISERLT
jgi:lactate 2-monooxygenase